MRASCTRRPAWPVRLTTLAALAGLAGCFDSPADQPEVVHDLRVLAVQLEPPEVVLPAGPVTPPALVRARVLLVDPGRGEVQVSVRGCPSASATGCDDSDPLALDPRLAALSDERRSTARLAGPPSAPEAVLSDERALPANLIGALLEDAPLGGLAGARPFLEVRAFSPADAARREVALKRLQVSYPDAVYRAVLDQIGLTLCDDEGRPEGCVPWRTRVPNTNPRITGVAWRTVEAAEAGEPAEPVGPEGITVAPSTVLRIEPAIDPDAVEPYQTLGVDLEDQKLVVNDYEELLVLSYFASAGTLDLAQVIPDRDFGAYDVWTAPEAPGEAWVWIVLRDNRGGEDFVTVPIHVTE